MVRNMIRALATIVGAAFGYGLSRLIYYILTANGVVETDAIPLKPQIAISIGFAAIFAFVFFLIAPAVIRRTERATEKLSKDLSNVSTGTIVGVTVGLIAGLVIAVLVSQLFGIITNRFVHAIIIVAVYIVFIFMGVSIGYSKGAEIFGNVLGPRKESAPKEKSQTTAKASGRRKAKLQTPKVLDTSVIIDGRIAEILKTGFIEGPIIIPEFVLVELRHIADSADDLKRERGRHGLDILNEIQKEHGIDIFNTDGHKELKEIPEVDVKLLKLAQILNGKVVTNDYNLNKVAGINGVDVLNINELANCLKPVVLPGERMSLHLVKKGKTPEQAIGYLNDGTMIVVEDGREELGNTTEIRVTSVLQTSAGRMIFGRLVK